MFSCVSRALKTRTFRWLRGDIYFPQLLERVLVSWELRCKEPVLSFLLMLDRILQQTFLCIVTWERRAEKLSFRAPGLFSLRLLSTWHHGCSIAVTSPWPRVSVLRRYCDLTIRGNAWACKVLGNDRAATLCISWKDSLYYLSTGLGELSWFYNEVKPKKKTPKM